MKRRTRNRKFEGSNFSFCKDIKLTMVAGTKRRRSSFMSVKESLLCFNTMSVIYPTFWNVRFLAHLTILPFLRGRWDFSLHHSKGQIQEKHLKMTGCMGLLIRMSDVFHLVKFFIWKGSFLTDRIKWKLTKVNWN